MLAKPPIGGRDYRVLELGRCVRVESWGWLIIERRVSGAGGTRPYSEQPSRSLSPQLGSHASLPASIRRTLGAAGGSLLVVRTDVGSSDG